MPCRVVQAQEALAEAHAEPMTPSGMAIIRQVYYPASVQIPAVRQVASYLELNNALEEVQATSFVDTLTARTSWILKPAEVRIPLIASRSQSLQEDSFKICCGPRSASGPLPPLLWHATLQMFGRGQVWG